MACEFETVVNNFNRGGNFNVTLLIWFPGKPMAFSNTSKHDGNGNTYILSLIM